MPMTWDEVQKRFPPGRIITACGSQRWRVQMPAGRDPATGKALHHAKAIRGMNNPILESGCEAMKRPRPHSGQRPAYTVL